jgi:hypothetical protein
MTRPLSNSQGILVIDPQQLTRSQRLERWALALEKLGDAPLQTLKETEHQRYHERMLMREDNSPLTVAFEEPVLRSAGLQDDTFGETRRFFDLSDGDLHNILCYCHFGPTVRASEVAARVRSVQARGHIREHAALLWGGAIAAVTFGTMLLLTFAG